MIQQLIVAGQPCSAPGDVDTQPLGPSIYYYGDLARNREKKVLDELPLTHRPLKSPKNADRSILNRSIKAEKCTNQQCEYNDARRTDNKICTLDGQNRKKKKHKFGRRRTNTFDGEIPHSKTKIERNGNSDGETDYIDNDFEDEIPNRNGFNFNCPRTRGKSGEDLPLLGITTNPCPVALADRSRAYLCKNLDLEADDVSLTYDEPNVARKSITYSNAGTFPMPDGKKGGHYDEPESNAHVALDGETDDWNGGVTRSRSWYLCCPGAGNGALQNPGSAAIQEDAHRTTPLPVTSAPSPGENQYVSNRIHIHKMLLKFGS